MIILEPEQSRSEEVLRCSNWTVYLLKVNLRSDLVMSKKREYHITSYQLHPFSENHDRCDFASTEVSFLDLFGDKKRKPNRKGQ